jgi:hypothetical protein
MAAVAAVAALTGCMPHDIARASCRNTVLSLHDEWTCSVKADVVGRSSSIEFDTESRNRVAQVSIDLRVAKGKLRVHYADLSGSQQIVVTPSEPASFEMKTQMHAERRSFTLRFEPVDGNVEGLAGTVKYATP